MKGQVEIEFIIAVFIFITTMSFVTFLIVNNIPAFHNTAVGELVKSRSYQYAEEMFFDEGSPTNWWTQNLGNTDRIGFSAGRRYLIDQNKLNKLQIDCDPSNDGYAAVKDKLDLEYSYDIIIEASYLDGSPVIGGSTTLCSPPIISQVRQQFHFTKLGVLNTADQRMIRMTFTLVK